MSESGGGQQGGPLPDRCPYRRPFPPDFSECPTFQAQRFVAATTQERPLGTHLTCVHLRVGQSAYNRFYAQCALGTAEERLRWLGQVGERRVATMRQLQREFLQLYQQHIDTLTAAKAAAIAAPDDPAAADELDRRMTHFTEVMHGFIALRATTFEQAGFPIDSLQSLVDQALERWRESPRLASPPVEPQKLEPFAPELRSFLGGSPREEQETNA